MENKRHLLLFLHGGGTSSWMWNEQVKFFEQDYAVWTPELPGHGMNEEKYFSIDETVDQLIRELDTVSFEQISVIGFSLGAQVALSLVSRQPERFERVVLVSMLASPLPFPTFIAKTTAMMHPLSRNRTFAKIQAKQLEVPSSDFERYFNDTQSITKSLLENIIYENSRFKLPVNVHELPFPILVMAGAKENRLIKKTMAQISNENEHVKTMMIDGAGHSLPYSHASLFNETVHRFLSQ
ncbi:alpha/beta fold hydrolase [Geomicrobium sediminis]|uniref:Pimeloyl-ACP methyl ester carboxylesterase n=1 Tax=Geomicrobium sediminis TaxID=1347788 RepID=A0ABS2PCV5_9BACL|nr:alpha/beta hydrolase [Geomicrobium sediminis]MBM7633277.1 pimeloyl-ACP methyl ester carboxylesterase [Geomicrobium sediminis]